MRSYLVASIVAAAILMARHACAQCRVDVIDGPRPIVGSNVVVIARDASVELQDDAGGVTLLPYRKVFDINNGGNLASSSAWRNGPGADAQDLLPLVIVPVPGAFEPAVVIACPAALRDSVLNVLRVKMIRATCKFPAPPPTGTGSTSVTRAG